MIIMKITGQQWLRLGRRWPRLVEGGNDRFSLNGFFTADLFDIYGKVIE